MPTNQFESDLNNTKKQVSAYIRKYLAASVLPSVSRINRWGNDAVRRIGTIAVQGKMLRSYLIHLSTSLFSHSAPNTDLLAVSAGMELLHTGLCIHDDIMDMDEMRRGLDSMHIQYQRLFEKEQSRDAVKTGESFAICTGDLVFFLATNLILTIQNATLAQKILALVNTELQAVCLAQMQDTFAGVSNRYMSQDDILRLYAYKTGRYSCGLPLVIGAMLVDVKPTTVRQLWKLGEDMGILYQIRDDGLNLFGDSGQTGKPIGSDIRQRKQTLYYHVLHQKSSPEDRARIQDILGKQTMTEADVTTIRNLIKHYAIDDDINIITERYLSEIRDIVHRLGLSENGLRQLETCITFITTRTA